MKEKDGSIASSDRRPHILADYFEESQCGQTKTPEDEKRTWPMHQIIDILTSIRTDDFDDQELVTCLRKMKNNKTPGSDDVPVEFYKWLDEAGRKEVLDILNTIKRDLASS